MKRGFTLIEIIVAVSIFTIVAIITTGALVTASDTNRKAQALKIAMDNVSFAMDSIVTNLREGAQFGCITGTIPDNPNGYLTSAQNSGNWLNTGCTIDGQGLIFESKRSGNIPNYIIYRFKKNAGEFGRVQVASSISSQYVDLTSQEEVDIKSLRFYVPNNAPKPRVTIVISGEVPGKTPTKFNLQTTVKANF